MAEPTSKPTLVLLHGAGHSARMWRHQSAALSGSFELLTPDLPGFAGEPGPFSLAGAVEQVAELLRDRAPAHVGGLSLGSLVAARLAVTAPELVARLVLAGPVITPAESGPRALRFYRRRLGWWLMRAVSDLPDRASLLSVVEELARTDISADLPMIKAATLVLCGKRDRACLPDARRMAVEIPRARLIVVPHTGHLIPMTAPNAFNNIVAGFLSTVDPK